jgi:hypothetical protein
MKSSSSDEISIFSGRVTIKCPMPPNIFERIADEFCLSDIYGAAYFYWLAGTTFDHSRLQFWRVINV